MFGWSAAASEETLPLARSGAAAAELSRRPGASCRLKDEEDGAEAALRPHSSRCLRPSFCCRHQKLLAVGLLLLAAVAGLHLMLMRRAGGRSPIVWYAGRVGYSLTLYFHR